MGKKARCVAPHGGAWIETLKGNPEFRKLLVAPHGGAWIETETYKEGIFGKTSPLTEGRGLKLCPHHYNHERRAVAPHGGAWIETEYCGRRFYKRKSPLTEGRGLKQVHFACKRANEGRPSRRGVD